MITRVMVELDHPSSKMSDDARVIGNILGEGYRVFHDDGNIFVDVHESDNAVEEVRHKLDLVCVGCLCYDWDDETNLD